MKYQYRVPGWVDTPRDPDLSSGPFVIDFDSDASPEPEDQPTLLEAAAQAHWDEHGGNDWQWPVTFEVYRPGAPTPLVTGEVLAILIPEFSARVLKPA
jgi:hypothetical protein